MSQAEKIDRRKKEHPTWLKHNGRTYKIYDDDADKTKPIPEMEDQDAEIVNTVLAKYGMAPMVPVLNAMMAGGQPIVGFSENLDHEYFIRAFLQIAFTASREYDRNKALENAARMMGYWNPDGNHKKQTVAIQINTHKPADQDVLNDGPIREEV